MSIWVTIPLIFLYRQTPHSPKKPQRRRYSSAACTNPGNEGSTTSAGCFEHHELPNTTWAKVCVQYSSTGKGFPRKAQDKQWSMRCPSAAVRQNQLPRGTKHLIRFFFSINLISPRTPSTSTGNTKAAKKRKASNQHNNPLLCSIFTRSPNGAEWKT